MPLFSVVHTTARHNWRETYTRWMRACDNPAEVEYVVCLDSRWGFIDVPDPNGTVQPDGSVLKVVYNTGRKCMVDGYTSALPYTTGGLLILNSDDMHPVEQWDFELADVSAGHDPRTEDFVIQVSSGTAADARGLMVLQILSRARYFRLGYALYPGYESMFADDDFSEHARADGVVCDARTLVFRHIHPEVNEGRTGLDDVYRHQNRQAAYALGSALIQIRRAINFGNSDAAPAQVSTRAPHIAICVPGDHFSGVWLGSFINLFSALVSHSWIVTVHSSYSSNVYITRRCILEGLKRMEHKPDYVLWMDDDNTPTPQQIQMLVDDLNKFPEAGIVAGWCYIQPDGFEIAPLTSCGYLGSGNSGEHITQEALQNTGDLLPIDFTGFPTVLMRYGVVEALPVTAFDPLPAPGSRWGFTGEDVSFCIAARHAGFGLYVDPRVHVEHWKLRPAVPNMPGARKAVEA